jgi:3-hydroxyethyl bacteriochlorophyllide a dehydrogenase
MSTVLDAPRAIVFAAKEQLEMRTLALRPMADDEVAVATRYSSISAGTERLIYHGNLPGFPMLRYPLVPGYEAAGIVTAVGADVHDVKPGDEVFVGGAMCYADANAAFGGQSSMLLKKAAQVVALRGIPLAQAPLLALAATSLHGVRRLGDVAGKRIAVLGMGAIGQFAARFLAAGGAHVICVDKSEARLDAGVGAERFALGDEPLEAHVKDLDAVVEATGQSRLLASCANALRMGGSIALLSYYDELVTHYAELFVKEVTLLVAREWSHADLLAARDIMSGDAIEYASLAKTVYPVGEFEQAYKTAFEDPSVLKVILQWA